MEGDSEVGLEGAMVGFDDGGCESGFCKRTEGDSEIDIVYNGNGDIDGGSSKTTEGEAVVGRDDGGGEEIDSCGEEDGNSDCFAEGCTVAYVGNAVSFLGCVF